MYGQVVENKQNLAGSKLVTGFLVDARCWVLGAGSAGLASGVAWAEAHASTLKRAPHENPWFQWVRGKRKNEPDLTVVHSCAKFRSLIVQKCAL